MINAKYKKTLYYGNTEAKQMIKPVFIGKKWTLEVALLPNGKIAGYITDAISAATTAFNDPNYSSRPSVQNIPKTVKAKLERLMRKAGWVEDVFALLKPEYLTTLAAKGNGAKLPVQYAVESLARVYYAGDINHAMFVRNFRENKDAYQCWLNAPKGIRCAMRTGGDASPVYSHDLVDKH